MAGGAALLYATEHEDPSAGPSRLRGDQRSISAFELGQHNRHDNLWVAIDGEVWDVTDFVQRHPGGSQILIDHAGKDVTKLFKGIHPAGTLEQNLREEQRMGRLDEDAIAKFRTMNGDEEDRIRKARDSLLGIDSIIVLDDFEKYARPVCPASAWDYYSTGVEGENSMKENSAIYDRVFFRPRVMRDVSDVDTSTKVLGVSSSIPLYVSPTARNGLVQPMGEVAVTKGAAAGGILQVLSHVASKSLEEVMKARSKGQQVAWQMYMKPDREVAAAEVRKAYELGAQSIWLTVDTVVLGKRTRERYTQVEKQPAPHGTKLTRVPCSREAQALTRHSRHDTNLTWEDIQMIKKNAPGLPVVLKGVGAWEDVVLAQQAGADAVVLSNHGGRQLDYANPPLKTLYDLNENAPQCLRRPDFQVFVDGGIRRGTDVLKALCLGANAVGLGRPFIYAAAGWGPDGVEKAIMILREELEISMRLLGVTNIDQLGPEYLNCSRI
ncbi:L-mandelate dehydrogenase [Kockovaella imperatae]|uniref:L-mandelate dehydrogenase n=1 Tax=Kockovaella imperatae TaxID=4999 RepID=A0A1Y1UFM8_9TREE|nr:L-mandelate dehydrogenase [Kockovaella imperatae]ORX36799.1 L-mandelate dehydrogenase [Kockovaella imperatae]